MGKDFELYCLQLKISNGDSGSALNLYFSPMGIRVSINCESKGLTVFISSIRHWRTSKNCYVKTLMSVRMFCYNLQS